MLLDVLEKRLKLARQLQELLRGCAYLGFSLQELSRILGYSATTLNKWAKGEWLPEEEHLVDAIEKLKALVKENIEELRYDFKQDLDISNVDPSFVFNAEIPKLRRFSRKAARKLRYVVYGDVRKLNMSLSYLTFYAGTLNITNKVLLHEAANMVRRTYKEKLVKTTYGNTAYIALAALKIAALKLKQTINIEPGKYGLDPEKYRRIFGKLAAHFLA